MTVAAPLLPSAPQRARGGVALSAKLAGGVSRLDGFRQEGSLKALFPRAMQRGEDIWSHIGPLTYREAPMEQIQLFESYGIYADRLRALDAYMQRWKPRGLRGLWRDHRDSYQWWTLWTVIVLGGVGLMVSVLTLGVGIAQLAVML